VPIEVAALPWRSRAAPPARETLFQIISI
jgi:hypothetical protein